MSSLHFGRWHCFRVGPRLVASLKAAVWVLLAPAVAITQDSPEILWPDLDADLLLMAEVVEVKAAVTFADPAGIGSVSDLQFGIPGQSLADSESVIVTPESGEGGTKANTGGNGPRSPAALTVKVTPGQPVTIAVDDVVTDPGIYLADFQCAYNAGGGRACDGAGFTETTAGSGTLHVGVTVMGIDTLVAGTANGSFDVTISYQ